MALGIMRRDLEGMREPGGKIDSFRAMSIANYVRALGSVSKARNDPSRAGKLGKTSMQDLVEEAIKEPMLLEALKGLR